MTEEMALEKAKGNLPMVRSNSLFFNVAMFDHVQRVAKVFASSTMVPAHFQGNIPNCIIGLNLANRMQIDPFMLFQNMHVIHGKPGIEAKLGIALTNGCGRFDPLQFRHENKGRGDDWGCVAYAKDLKSGKVLESATVSIKMAKDEGWYSKSGSKWKTMPELMLEYRSAMFFARVYCPEVLLGLKTREEIYDIVDLEPGKNGTYSSQEADKEPKEKPNYAAQDLKDKLDAGDEEVEGYSKIKDNETKITGTQADIEEAHTEFTSITELKNRMTEKEATQWRKEEEPEPSPLEQGEPVGTLPAGVDPIEWLISCRPSSSVSNAKGFIAVYEEQIDKIEALDDKIRGQLTRKLAKTKAYLADIEAKKQAIAEEKVSDDDQIPEFEQPMKRAPGGYDADGRLAYITKMREYKGKDSDKYAKVLMNNSTEEKPLNDMNDVKAGEEGAILHFMSVEFGEV